MAARGRRRARVLDRGRHVHAAHGPDPARPDARGHARPADGRRVRHAAGGPAPDRRGGDGAPARAVPGGGPLLSRGGEGGCSRHYPRQSPMKVLLTNDDGIQAQGLNAARRALLEVPGIDLTVIAPDSNRSATARSITTRDPLWVEEIEFEDGSVGYATDGTPVDCVRFAVLGLTESQPELIVSGINHGTNLGDDITYSGTVAAALEGVVLGIPAIAVSQQSTGGEMDFSSGLSFDFQYAAAFTARLVEELEQVPMPDATLLNINVPTTSPRARGRAGSASASTATGWSSPRRK